jgi:hypothetical protein
MMADKKDKAQQGKQDQLTQASDQTGAQNRQGAGQQQGSGSKQQDNDGSRNSSFLHSSPEANVFPAGARQGDNSDRSSGDQSAAGTPDEGRLGGSGGTSAAGTTGNDPDR